MKNKKLALAVAMIASVSALSFGQKVEFHGYTDYSSSIIGYSTKVGSADWDSSDLYAVLGSYDGGMTQADLKVTAANFQFNFGLRLASDLSAYKETDGSFAYGEYVPWYQGNMRIDFLNGLASVYTGKFEDFNLGYHTTGFADEGAYANDFANSDTSQYFGGVELKPEAYVEGLSFLVGVPILAESFNNGIDSMTTNDKLQTVARQAKIGVKYVAPFGVNFLAGYQNALWDVGNDSDPDKLDEYVSYYDSTDKFREAWINAEITGLLEGLEIRAGYNFQQRLADLSAMKHNVLFSASYKPLEGLFTALDGRVALATNNFETDAKTILFYSLKLKATYDLTEEVLVGLKGNVSYLTDSSGQIATGEVSDDSGDLGFSVNEDSQAIPTAVSDDLTGSGYGVGVNPYIQRNFSNGYVSAGVQAQLNSYKAATTSAALTYAIPVRVVFWF